MNQQRPLRKIVFSFTPDAERFEHLQESFPDLTMVVAKDDALPGEITDAQAIVGGKIPDATLEVAGDLAWLHVPWAGLESVLSPALVARDIVITNSRGVSAPNIAEHIVAMMLAFGRALPTLVRRQEKRQWLREERPPVFELTGQTVLLLGVGAIGQTTAARLRPFNARLIGARRRAEGAAVQGFDRVISFAELEEHLPTADHVVSSLPLTPATRGILSEKLIGLMKPGAYFYNVGRGGTVDQAALVAALERGHLAGAGLDVTDPEPLPEDSPLWDMPNVLITAHTSGGSPMAGARVYELIAENIRRFRDGRELLNVVDVEAGY